MTFIGAVRTFIIGAGLLAMVSAAPRSAAEAQTAGYLWLQQFSANTAASGQKLALSGLFVNDCNGGLPPGAFLQISFDQAPIFNVRIQAGFGKSQQFKGTVSVPKVPPPRFNTTAYRLAVIVPGAGPDMKTSPCCVTPILGTPTE